MESSKYVCIFESGKSCPAKTAYKLSPESLAQFCKVCVEKTKWDTIIQAMKTMAEMATSLQKNSEERPKNTSETKYQNFRNLFPETTGELMKGIGESIKSMRRDPKELLKETEVYEAFIKERKRQLQAEIKSEDEQKKHIPDGVA